MSEELTSEEEVQMIRAIAEALALRVGLDLADGKLMERPVLLLLFICENLLDRIKLLEDQRAGTVLVQPH